jgi:hypothetical protein
MASRSALSPMESGVVHPRRDKSGGSPALSNLAARY